MFFFCYIKWEILVILLLIHAGLYFLGQSIKKPQSLYRLAHGVRPDASLETIRDVETSLDS